MWAPRQVTTVEESSMKARSMTCWQGHEPIPPSIFASTLGRLDERRRAIRQIRPCVGRFHVAGVAVFEQAELSGRQREANDDQGAFRKIREIRLLGEDLQISIHHLQILMSQRHAIAGSLFSIGSRA